MASFRQLYASSHFVFWKFTNHPTNSTPDYVTSVNRPKPGPGYTYWFSTSTMVARTLLNITLYIQYIAWLVCVDLRTNSYYFPIQH